MVNFSGKWAIAKHDNLDGVIAALNIPADKRPDQPITGLTSDIQQNGDNFKVHSSGKRGTRDTTFTVGTTFEAEFLQGTVTAKVTAAWEGDKLVLTGEKGNKITRELVGGQLVSTIIAGGSSAKLYFNKA